MGFCLEKLNMPVLELEDKTLESYELINSGSEGQIYKIDEATVVKIFRENPIYLENKIGKIEELSKLYIRSFVLPKKMVILEDISSVGYSMDFINSSGDLLTMCFDANVKKILTYIVKADRAIKRAHRKGLILGDVAARNILIDRLGNPIFIDTDNCIFKGYKEDIQSWEFESIEETYGKSIVKDRDIDIFLFGMMAIDLLFPRIRIYDRCSDEFYREFINALNVSSEVKEGLRIILSDAKDKPYFSDVIDASILNRPLLDPKEEKYFHL